MGDARRDPYPLYARLRENDPLHRSYAVRGWILFRHADCVEVLRDPRFSADDRRLAAFERRRAEAIREGLVDPEAPQEPVMLRRDPPDHTRLRSLVNKAFTPRAVEKLRPRVEQLAEELLSDLTGSSSSAGRTTWWVSSTPRRRRARRCCGARCRSSSPTWGRLRRSAGACPRTTC
jgi:hypothetical protein